MTTVIINGVDFIVEVVDSTHVTMRLANGTIGKGWPYHVGQLGTEVTRQLKELGVMDDRGYVR